MKVKMLMDWGGHAKGAVVDCSDEAGCHMICTGVASVEEQTKPDPEEKRGVQDPKDHPAPKEE